MSVTQTSPDTRGGTSDPLRRRRERRRAAKTVQQAAEERVKAVDLGRSGKNLKQVDTQPAAKHPENADNDRSR